MELRQLRYFEVIATTLNFSRAAEELDIAQPALSRQIQKLEDDLGVLLIDRTGRPLKLTPAGVYFHRQAGQVLARLDEIRHATLRIAEERRVWMGIGFVGSILYGVIPAVIQEFKGVMPSVDLELFELISVEQGEALKSGKIDVGFGRLPIDDPLIHNELIAEERLTAAVPVAHPFVSRSAVTLADLSQCDILVYPTGPHPNFSDQVTKIFNMRGLTANCISIANSLQTAIGMVAAGMGVAMVPESVRRLQRKDIAYVPIETLGVTTPLIMATRKGATSDQLDRFCEMVRHAFEPAEP